MNSELIELALKQLMSGAYRLDANETAVLVQQLEHRLAIEKEIGYTPLKTLSFFPVSSEIDPGAETWYYEEWDHVGMAKIISNYADDLPMVDVIAKKVTGSVQSYGVGYQYSRQDLRRAAKSGTPLSARRRRAARLAFDRLVDKIAAVGDPAAKLRGVLTHPNLPIVAAAAPGTGSDATWDGGDKTPKEVVADMNAVCDQPWLNTKETWAADTLLLAPERLAYVRETPYGAQENSDSILTVFLKNHPTVKNVDSWSKLSTASATGGPAALAYARNPQVVEVHLPMGFTEYEPQIENLAFKVPCEGRVAGVALYEPLAMARMDGI